MRVCNAAAVYDGETQTFKHKVAWEFEESVNDVQQVRVARERESARARASERASQSEGEKGKEKGKEKGNRTGGRERERGRGRGTHIPKRTPDVH